MYMRWEKAENQRYYEALLNRDLFGWVVTRVWGRKGTLLGQVVHRPYVDVDEGKEQMIAIHKRRLQKGYVRVCSRGY